MQWCINSSAKVKEGVGGYTVVGLCVRVHVCAVCMCMFVVEIS